VDRTVIDAVLTERRDRSGEDEHPDGPSASPDRIAAERLIARHARALARVPDPRKRRQRAYALLARNGFDAETCREVAALVDATAEPEPLADED
jgi:hypothetical protein